MSQIDYREFDSRYRRSLGSALAAGDYAIFYSQILRSSLMIIGHNPGGNPDECGPQSLKIEEGFHDYVNNAEAREGDRYPLATAMRGYLTRVLGIGLNDLRRIPKINLVFRRSEDEARFAGHHADISMWNAANHDRPFVEELIESIEPSGIIFEGHKAWNKFCVLYCASDCPAETVVRAGNNVRMVQLARPLVKCLDRTINAVILAHPSRYGTWKATAEGDEAVRAHLEDCKGNNSSF